VEQHESKANNSFVVSLFLTNTSIDNNAANNVNLKGTTNTPMTNGKDLSNSIAEDGCATALEDEVQCCLKTNGRGHHCRSDRWTPQIQRWSKTKSTCQSTARRERQRKPKQWKH